MKNFSIHALSAPILSDPRAIMVAVEKEGSMKECNECFAYGRHEKWCDKTR